ncbi:hypothetical protein [Capnocytophaga canis]|uniref:hypothetical protein n=1 Tax=Capnocytophaga canis TaxID=1848903 RepID=UPI0015626590|nr:hypothetical protein [Capnocytophaga canis]
MKIAFISSEIWSDYNPEGIVARKILNGFLQEGHEVDVFTVKPFEYDRIIVFSNKIPEIFDKVIKNIIGLEKLPFVYKVYNYIKRNHAEYDLIITRSEPISLHLINIYLKTSAKKVAMFSDVGYLNPYYGKIHFVKKTISYLLEKKLSYRCDLITHTNQYVIEEYIKRGFSSKVFYDFPNPLEKSVLELKNRGGREKINLAYTGSLYGNRNPNKLFEYLQSQKKDNFTLYLIGAVRNMYYENGRLGKIGEQLKNKELASLERTIGDFGLSEKVRVLPFMKKRELNDFITKNIDILINIDACAETNLFLSSKVVDYLQYNLPILNVSTKGASVSFLKKVGIYDYLDYNNTFSFSIEDIAFSERFRPNKTLIDQFLVINIVKRLLNRINLLHSNKT